MDRLSLPRSEFVKWYRVAILFLAPVLTLYIIYVLNNMGDGFKWSDFIPNLFIQGAIVAYFLNEVLAYLKRVKESK